MLLLLFAAICLCSARSSVYLDNVCQGQTYVLQASRIAFARDSTLFFRPSSGGPRKLVMNGTKGVDPRYVVDKFHNLVLMDVSEQDDGIFSTPGYGRSQFDLFTLRVKDCAKRETKRHGETLSAYFSGKEQIFEFRPDSTPGHIEVLWNRTDPSATSRRLTIYLNKWSIKRLTPADNGGYTMRMKDGVVFSQIKLKVKERTETTETLDLQEGETLYFTADLEWPQATLIFRTSEEEIEMIRSGASGDTHRFGWRFTKVGSGQVEFQISHLKDYDSGTYIVQDEDGFVVHTLHLVVSAQGFLEAPVSLYVGVPVGIIVGLIICCCCVKRCCCGSKSSKDDEAEVESPDEPAAQHNPPPAAAPSFSPSPKLPQYTYHPVNPASYPAATGSSSVGAPVVAPTQPPAPTYPGYSHVPYQPYRPATPVNQPEPASTSTEPPPQMAPTAHYPAAPAMTLGSDSLSSTADHRFELKGLLIPPLSSDSTIPDVYQSSKLNFA